MPLRPSLSCTRCTQRKVRCDRTRPICGSCAKQNASCDYLPETEPRKRTRRRVKDLTEQIKKYEALLQQQSSSSNNGDIDVIPPLFTPDSLNRSIVDNGTNGESRVPAAGQCEPNVTTSSSRSKTLPEYIKLAERLNKTQVLTSEGRAKFVDNDLWYRVVEELRTPEDALDDTSDVEHDDTNGSDVDNAGLVLSSGTASNTRLRHPQTADAQRLFDIFAKNVDPLTKIVHVPTLRAAFQKAICSTEGISKGFEALIFAIYSAAVMSLKDDECQSIFGSCRKDLFRHYTKSARKALARANFMSTISLVVLQALLIYIIAIRDTYEPRGVWTLTGVAIRIAQGMGIDRDGTQLKLPIFESEMRRRIWWLLQTHDWRCAELCGLAKFRNMESRQDAPLWPANIDDDELRPDMTSLSPHVNRITDMTFMCSRSELVRFATQRIARLKQEGRTANLVSALGLLGHREEVEKACNEIQEVFETKYIRYCDPAQPMHLMVMILARYAVNVTRFLMNHPRQWENIEKVPPEERKYVWELSIRLLEQHVMILSNPLLKQFSWHAPFFIQWHGFIHTLDVLRTEPSVRSGDRAWELIAKLYEYNKALTKDMRKPIHVAVGSLCLKAYEAREGLHRVTNNTDPVTPAFIQQLREALEKLRTKTQARRNKHADKAAKPAFSDGHLLGEEAPFQARVSSSIVERGKQTPDANAHYWLESGVEIANADFEVPDFMNIDSSVGLSQNFLDAPASAALQIDWAQWDAWLANSNVMAPYLSPDSSESTVP